MKPTQMLERTPKAPLTLTFHAGPVAQSAALLLLTPFLGDASVNELYLCVCDMELHASRSFDAGSPVVPALIKVAMAGHGNLHTTDESRPLSPTDLRKLIAFMDWPSQESCVALGLIDTPVRDYNALIGEPASGLVL